MATLWLGITFVLVGAINVWLILQASARVRDARGSARLVAAHRIGGYVFIALFCVMGYFMIARLGDVGSGSLPTTLIHLTLAMVLSPLIFVKVLVARYYKSYYSFLMPIGLVIFVLSFVLIGITAGPSLAHRATLPPAAIDLSDAAATMEKRCSKCHNLDRIAGARKDASGWLATVNRMRALPDSGISESDSRTIVSYLASQMAPKQSNLEVGRALVDQRCGRCHSLDRVYKTAQTPEQWQDTVAEMGRFAQGSVNALQPGEDRQIVAYLAAAQTPEAVNRRKNQVAAPPPQTGVEPDRPAARGGYDVRTIGFLSAICLGMLALIVRRPGRAPQGAATASAPAPARPLILKLASITQQTPDASTLRFIVPTDRKLNARPGQFLTFSFLFDGKKTTRSYSICSSVARSGYVEITPKRVSDGCVSVFLTCRAFVGLTVEASGPFGQFCFDENRHRNVVLLAAGSGITPMIAILRYIDDLCLDTTVTLLYCVRTIDDIIFRAELESLQTRLKNFRYRTLLSQQNGRMTREFIQANVADVSASDFFLCGPPAFMETSRGILTGMGVKSERISQESFGGATPVTAEAGAEVEFARSGKTCIVRGGQTILEAAEEHGVAIPSSCRQGQCGTCKTKLLEGTVRMDAEQGLDSDSRARGFVLTCVGRANGPVKLDA